MKKIYTEEQKCTILQRYWSGESVSSISADTGVAKSTLYKWIREAPPKKAKPVNMTDFRILKQRCETLEQMVEILQMSPCTVSAPLHDRYEDIKDLSVLLRFFKSCTNFLGFPKSQFDYKKIRNGVKSRFLCRFSKTNNTPIELLWFKFGVLFSFFKSANSNVQQNQSSFFSSLHPNHREKQA